MRETDVERTLQDDPRADQARRSALRAARACLIYALLIGGSAVFTLPFLWMLGTSFKVDREIFTDEISLWPMRPIPRAQSPYLDERYYVAPSDAVFAEIREPLERAIALKQIRLPQDTADADRAAEILAPGVYRRLRDTLPGSTWEGTPVTVAAVAQRAVTQDLVSDVTRNILRRLTFGSVRVRSFDLQEFDVTEGVEMEAFWTREADAQAHLRDRGLSATEGRSVDLAYRFDDRGSGTIRLSQVVDLGFAADRLQRAQIFLRPDDSWHRVDFFLEKNGKRFQGRRSEYLGDFQWTTVTLQDFTERGEKYRPDISKIRLWLPMKEVAAGPEYDHGPDRARIELAIKRNSALGAWWAKAKKNYRGALNHIPFWRYTATSFFLVILNIVGTVFSCSLVAYAFARLQWPGRNFCFALMLATLMIPPQVVMIPYFLIIKHLGWYNTLKPLWVISFFGNAFSIFLLRQFMKGIPRDLEDAARIDGCNFMQIYWYVMLPLIKPTLACIAIFTFMGVWNDFMGPLIYLSDQRLYPLSLGLYAFNVQSGTNYGMMMAGSLLMTLPIIILFFFAQKYFIQGITLTGMKG